MNVKLSVIKLSARELYAIAERVTTMKKIERQVRRLNEHDCNYGLSPRQEARRLTLENQYKILAESFGLFTEVQRDPRGGALKLHDSSYNMDSSMGVVL